MMKKLRNKPITQKYMIYMSTVHMFIIKDGIIFFSFLF